MERDDEVAELQVHVDVSLPGTPLSSVNSGRSSRSNASANSMTATTPTCVRLEEAETPVVRIESWDVWQMNCRVPNVYVVICFIRDACLLCTSHLMCHPHPLKPHPTPPRAWPGESGDNHLIFTSLCFPGGWGEHSLICVARVHISSFRNALLGLVRGFKEGCHSRLYTGDFGLYSWVPRDMDFNKYFCPGVQELLWLSHSHWVECPSHAWEGEGGGGGGGGAGAGVQMIGA